MSERKVLVRMKQNKNKQAKEKLWAWGAFEDDQKAYYARPSTNGEEGQGKSGIRVPRAIGKNNKKEESVMRGVDHDTSRGVGEISRDKAAAVTDSSGIGET